MKTPSDTKIVLLTPRISKYLPAKNYFSSLFSPLLPNTNTSPIYTPGKKSQHHRIPKDNHLQPSQHFSSCYRTLFHLSWKGSQLWLDPVYIIQPENLNLYSRKLLKINLIKINTHFIFNLETIQSKLNKSELTFAFLNIKYCLRPNKNFKVHEHIRVQKYQIQSMSPKRN